MSADIATIVISGISALASVIRAWNSAKQKKRKITPKQIDRAATPRKPILTEKQIESLSKVVPDEIFEAMLEKINEAIKRFTDAIKDPGCNEQCQEHEHRIASNAICRQLKRMKKLNNNQLPKKLENLWISFQCK